MIDWVNHPKLRKMIELHEGKRNYIYNDKTGKIITSKTGKMTVGIGRNIEDVPLSEDEIQYLLSNDLKRTIDFLDKRFMPWWREMKEARQAVLIDMCFNLGGKKLMVFVNTLASMKAGHYATTVSNMEHSLWYKQVGTRARRLVDMMKTGEWYSE